MKIFLDTASVTEGWPCRLATPACRLTPSAITSHRSAEGWGVSASRDTRSPRSIRARASRSVFRHHRIQRR